MGTFSYKKGQFGYAKFYVEITVGFTQSKDSARGNNKNFLYGLVPSKNKNFGMYIGEEEGSIGYQPQNCYIIKEEGNQAEYGSILREGDKLGLYFDFDDGSVRYFINDKDQGEALKADRIKNGEFSVAISYYTDNPHAAFTPLDLPMVSKVISAFNIPTDYSIPFAKIFNRMYMYSHAMTNKDREAYVQRVVL